MSFREDVLQGLARRPRAIPARWLYDAAGAALFERITALPEYYPTRVEAALLARAVADLPRGRVLVEFGAGSAAKTRILLRHLDPAAYVPIDLSPDWLATTVADLAAEFPALPVRPVVADFTTDFALPSLGPSAALLGFFPGSTIGNFVPAAAVALLHRFREQLGDHAQLLIGVDTLKDEAVLRAAYDDAAGITARFNLNLLARINRELAGTIPLDAFAHAARWNAAHARIEMHLRALRSVTFTVAGRPFALDAGETIHSENSHKYGARDGDLLLRAGGWEPEREWVDEERHFRLVLCRSAPPPLAP